MSNHEQIAQVAHDKWANERFAQKIWLKKSKILFFSMFYLGFLFLKISDSLISSFLVSDVSKSLRSLTKNEQIARFFERITHSLIFSQKTSDLLRKQMSEFPALRLYNVYIHVCLFLHLCANGHT